MRSHAHPWFADARFELALEEAEEFDALKRFDDARRMSAQLSEAFGVKVMYAHVQCEHPGFNARLFLDEVVP